MPAPPHVQRVALAALAEPGPVEPLAARAKLGEQWLQDPAFPAYVRRELIRPEARYVVCNGSSWWVGPNVGRWTACYDLDCKELRVFVEGSNYVWKPAASLSSGAIEEIVNASADSSTFQQIRVVSSYRRDLGVSIGYMRGCPCMALQDIVAELESGSRELSPGLAGGNGGMIAEDIFACLLDYVQSGPNPEAREMLASAIRSLYELHGSQWVESLFVRYSVRRQNCPSTWNERNCPIFVEHSIHPIVAAIIPFIELNASTVRNLFAWGLYTNDAALVRRCLELQPDLLDRKLPPLDDQPFQEALRMGAGDVLFEMIEFAQQRGLRESLGRFAKMMFDDLRYERDASRREGLSRLLCLVVTPAFLETKIPASSDGYGGGGVEVPRIEIIHFHHAYRCLREGVLRDSKIALTPRIVADLEFHQQFAPLVLRGLMTQEEADLRSQPQVAGTVAELCQQSLACLTHLTQAARVHHGDVHAIDPRLISEARRLKSQLKERAKTLTGKDKEQCEGVHTRLALVYDQIVDRHPLFSMLRQISRDLRAPRPTGQVPKRLISLYSLCNAAALAYTSREAESHVQNLQDDPGRRRRVFCSLREQTVDVAIAHESVLAHAAETRLWMHGTKSSSLSGVVEQRGIMPLGQLMATPSVAFSGENHGTEGDFNQKDISGELFSRSWEDGGTLYHDAATRLLVCILYAMKETGYGPNPKQFRLEEAKAMVQPEAIAPLLDRADQKRLSGVRMAILRLRAFGELDEDSEAYKALHVYLVGAGSDRAMLLEALKRPTTLLREDQKKWVTTPFPIVFASSTLEPVARNIGGEHMVRGAACLGSDIQYAFTDAAHVAELQQALAAHNVQVYPFEVAMQMEALYLSECAAWKEFIHGPTTSQEQLGAALERWILPAYSKPLPERPSYVGKTGSTVVIDTPFYGHGLDYATYRAGYEAGQTLPRDIHGRLHATRVAIGYQLMGRIRQEMGSEHDLSPVGVLAAAAHDWQRQDEGEDHWDEASAEGMHRFLRARNIPPDLAQRYRDGMRDKDPKGHVFTTPFQAQLHDADVLEIIRVLPGQDQFRTSELSPGAFPSDAVRDKVIAEWHRFIQETEPMKGVVEWEVDFTYLHVMRYLAAHQDKFPTIAHYLRSELASFQIKK
ncbi:MAG: hypothetical protein RL235_1096 [Chlamydiota bacterium]